MKFKILLSSAFFAAVCFSASQAAAQTALTVTAPAGGQSWSSGTTQTITWTPNNASGYTSGSNPTVNLNLYPSSACTGGSATSTCAVQTGMTPYIIALNVPNTGSYLWAIPAGLPATYQGQDVIQVSLSDSSALGTSGQFSIMAAAASSTPTTIATSTMPLITQLNPTSGPTGTAITVTGSGFATSSNTVLFGPGTYINNINSSNGSSLQFTVPTQTQPCPPSNTGACTLAPALITFGTYNVSVSNASGTSNTLPFVVASTTGSSVLPPLPLYPDGSLLLATDNPTVYLVRGGILVPFSSAKIFLGWGYQWSQIQVVAPSQLNGITVDATPVQAMGSSASR